ncbi:hypothetical protein [Buchnera aphidicola]|uniref:hypothetical protein n=1 Tax=Buchnera aphidicola TaxID=9 RepID=UPI003D18DE8F
MIKKLTKSSQLILKNHILFINKKVIYYGNIQDKIPDFIPTIYSTIYTHMYNHYNTLINNIQNHTIYYSLFPHENIISNFDTLIYFWPKNKSEANFQLQYFFSIFKKKNIFL